MATAIIRFEYPATTRHKPVIGFRFWWKNRLRSFYFANFEYPRRSVNTKRGQWWKRGGIEQDAPHGLKFTTFRGNGGIRLVFIELASGNDFDDLETGFSVENIYG